MSKRRLVLAAVVLLLLAGSLAVAWEVNDWPPARLILSYGFPPAGGPTGEVREIEGIEFVELAPGYYRSGTHRFCESGDVLGRISGWFGLDWGTPPKHREEMCPRWVEIPRGFWIATTELTRGVWYRYLEMTGKKEKVARWREPDDMPIETVTRRQAREFCAWPSDRAGVRARLPFEREWEYACRAGSTAFYCFGDDEARLGEYAWFLDNAKGKRRPVSGKKPNVWGLFDLHGNVREWCEDARRVPGGPEGTSKYPPGPTVHLGGGCYNPAENQGCGQRVFWARDMSDLSLGFRPVFTVPEGGDRSPTSASRTAP